MIRIKDFEAHDQQVVTGMYRVTAGKNSRWNAEFDGQSVRLEIGDYTGHAALIMMPNTQQLDLQAGQIIEAIVRPRQLTHANGGCLDFARVIDPIDVQLLPGVIPLRACPPCAQGALNELVDLWDCFEQPDLRRFLSSVLDRHFHDILTAQGGWQYYHDYPGGLLVHCVSTAQECWRQAQRAFSDDPLRIQLIVAAALLHDLGKAIQVVRGTSNAVIKAIPHEILSLQMMHNDLVALGQTWPEGGAYLADVLCWLAKPQANRKQGHDAELVHFADVLDVKAYRQQIDTKPLAMPTQDQSNEVPLCSI